MRRDPPESLAGTNPSPPVRPRRIGGDRMRKKCHINGIWKNLYRFLCSQTERTIPHHPVSHMHRGGDPASDGTNPTAPWGGWRNSDVSRKGAKDAKKEGRAPSSILWSPFASWHETLPPRKNEPKGGLGTFGKPCRRGGRAPSSKTERTRGYGLRKVCVQWRIPGTSPSRGAGGVAPRETFSQPDAHP